MARIGKTGIGKAGVAALTLWLGLYGPILAQDTAPTAPEAPSTATPPQDRAATLADLRADLNALKSALTALRAELLASGKKGFDAAGGDAAIDRMNAMEARLSQLTGEVEQLQNRVRRITRDATNRIGDIEFRICEMEEGCDLGALTTPDLGDQPAPAAIPSPEKHSAVTTPLARRNTASTAAERAAFDTAQAALTRGDLAGAADLFGALATTHAGGPLTAEALYLRGAALDAMGARPEAAKAMLESFAADPKGDRAPESLLSLSRLMGDMGKTEESCLFLAELSRRFATTASAQEASRRMEAAACDSPIDS